MDKLIKELEHLISDNLSYGLFEDMSRAQNIAISLSASLRRYRARQLRSADSSAKYITFQQWHLISLLFDRARDLSKMLDGSFSSSCDCWYSRGYVDAVFRMMSILGIKNKNNSAS